MTDSLRTSLLHECHTKREAALARQNATVTLDRWEDLTGAFKAMLCGTHRDTVTSRMRTILDLVQIGLIGGGRAL